MDTNTWRKFNNSESLIFDIEDHYNVEWLVQPMYGPMDAHTFVRELEITKIKREITKVYL
jgi:hypothetical protein